MCESIIRLFAYSTKALVILVKATTGALTFNEAAFSRRSARSHRNFKCILFKSSAFVSAISVVSCIYTTSFSYRSNYDSVLFSPRAHSVPSPDAFIYSSERGADGKKEKGRGGRYRQEERINVGRIVRRIRTAA